MTWNGLGVEMKDSVALHRSFRTRRMKLLNSKGGLFMLSFRFDCFLNYCFVATANQCCFQMI